MKKLALLLVMVCLSMPAYAQKDTVHVQGLYESGFVYGTLNTAIEEAIAAGTINNTVFKLKPYEQYVLSRSIYLDHGQNLEIVAPKPLRAGDADPETVQNSAPPQILWTEEGIDRQYMIQSYGDITMKNIWVRFTDTQGGKMTASIVFENQNAENKPETGIFDGCIFDYFQIGAEAAGAITVKSTQFNGTFTNCYFRNGNDPHFQYYGRAVSFPYQSSGWHYEHLLFENCTFTNLSRIVMQEGNEYGSNVQINHCTMVNSIEWPWQSAGWLETASITNSIFVNPAMMGYRAVDVCDAGQTYRDFQDGKCNSPGGGLINGITAVDSMGFEVPFTDYDRKLFIGNLAYLYQDWMLDWYTNCGWCQERIRSRESDLLRNPPPMLGQNEIDFIDSTDADGNKVFQKLNVDWATIYDEDPDFIVPPTNVDTLKLFIEYKWSTHADIDWSYKPAAGFNQQWPLPENLAYNHAAYQTAAIGGFPLGDLNWYPDQLEAWETQRDEQWAVINNWLETGTPDGTSVRPGRSRSNLISGFSLSCSPNPFNPTTQIHYKIPRAGEVTLKVYNYFGQEVATLVESVQQAGQHQVTFDGTGLASGTYFYRLESGDVSLTEKFTFMK
ncbi:MAG TPA: T9SS type A sorting domain-containing protein [bacterium]|nr:T9SS type A sorting domain-containing protein [bacterium]